MGNRQSQPAPRHDFNGRLFGGHYPGDFSIRVSYCRSSLTYVSRSSFDVFDREGCPI